MSTNQRERLRNFWLLPVFMRFCTTCMNNLKDTFSILYCGREKQGVITV